MSNQRIRSDSGTSNALKAFAAIVRSGLILLIGATARKYQHAVLSAMEPMTRLVINCDSQADDMPCSVSEPADLRVAVHCQNPEEFLDDVSQHLLNLVVTDDDYSERLASQITSMLVEGGCWVILNASDDGRYSSESFHPVNFGGGLLLVKKSEQQSSVRRGGRRARLSIET